MQQYKFNEGPLTAVVVTLSVVSIDSKKVGQLARTYRKDAGMSLKRLAESMGISFAHLSKLERGARAWSLELISKFNKGLRQ